MKAQKLFTYIEFYAVFYDLKFHFLYVNLRIVSIKWGACGSLRIYNSTADEKIPRE